MYISKIQKIALYENIKKFLITQQKLLFLFLPLPLNIFALKGLQADFTAGIKVSSKRVSRITVKAKMAA